MKKIQLTVLLMVSIMLFCACGDTTSQAIIGEAEEENQQVQDAPTESDKPLSPRGTVVRGTQGVQKDTTIIITGRDNFQHPFLREQQDTVAEPAFTNKYGTRNTLCAHSGCTNYIATSGNTNCCTTHSNKCYECGCYIDEDASWCTDCLAKAANQAQQGQTHYCEECNSTASYSIIGITGRKEYYCYKHYKEMQELMKWLLEN